MFSLPILCCCTLHPGTSLCFGEPSGLQRPIEKPRLAFLQLWHPLPVGEAALPNGWEAVALPAGLGLSGGGWPDRAVSFSKCPLSSQGPGTTSAATGQPSVPPYLTHANTNVLSFLESKLPSRNFLGR